MHVTNFQHEHLERLIKESPHWYKDITLADPGRMPLINTARTLWDGQRVLACVGIQVMHHGYATAWMFRGKHTHDYPVFVVRQIRALLHLAAERFKLHRIDAAVPTAMVTWHRFMETLGFHAESVMPRYGPKQEEFLRFSMFPGG